MESFCFARNDIRLNIRHASLDVSVSFLRIRLTLVERKNAFKRVFLAKIPQELMFGYFTNRSRFFRNSFRIETSDGHIRIYDNKRCTM